MSDHQHVRIHLRQIIMVGDGDQARFAKVLIGIRQYDLDQQFTNDEALIAVDVYGCVTGASNSFRTTPVEPHLHLLASCNILSIEDMALAPDMHLEACPPGEAGGGRRFAQPCTMHERHGAHDYQDPRAMISCPGFPS